MKRKKHNLSDTLIASLPVTKGVAGARIMDNQIKGFCARHTAAGVWHFYLRYKQPESGATKETHIGRWSTAKPSIDGCFNTKDARHEASKTLGKINEGKQDPITAKRAERECPTLAEFIDRPDQRNYPNESFWQIRVRQTTDHASEQANMERHVLPVWGSVKLSQITRESINAWVLKNTKTSNNPDGYAANTIRLILNPFRMCLNLAVEAKLIQVNPCTGVKKPKQDKNRKHRNATPNTIKTIRAALRERDAETRLEGRPAAGVHFVDYMEPFVIVLINSGVRPIELLRLKWGAVDIAKGTLTIIGRTGESAGTKSGNTRTALLTSEAAEVLTKWRSQSARASAKDLVFPSPVTGRQMDKVGSAYGKLLRKCGIKEGGNLYAMRHAFGTEAAQVLPLVNVMNLMGHSDIKTTMIYVQPAAIEASRGAIEQIMTDRRKAEPAILT